MKVEILSPTLTLFSEDDIDLLRLPGSDGSFEILSRHAPMVAKLIPGKIKLVYKNNQTKFIEINGGILEVRENKVVILINS